ncbi:MAG: carbon-nitrogen hydrolase family protein [Gammaproteobacteria bacterium]|nr:carbon-nitrogen hydrolase family protein [Gammaproteobacteria bacterium]
MSRKTSVGVVQMCATSDVAKNLDATLSLVVEASRAGAEVVLVPEAFAFIGRERDRSAWLETLPAGGTATPGPILGRCAETARSTGVHLVLGGFPELAPDGRAYNTCVHLTPDGGVAAAYRKIHLFDVDLADGTRLLESRATAPGDRAVVTDTPFGSLGLTVCYDVRFPLLYQRLADLGAVAIAVPSAFTKTTGRDHWHVLLRARAIECQCYIVAPAQHGDHGHRGRQSYGHGLIVDPWGDIVAECEGGDGFAIADIDPARVAEVRGQLPSLANRGEFR